MTVLSEKITAPLRTFIEPQIEQLDIRLRAIPCGILGTVSPHKGKGYVWAVDFEGDCLLSIHHLVLNKAQSLEERPTTYSCICSVSQATVESSKEFLPISHPRPEENICTFSNEGGEVSCTLEAHIPYDSISISYTPSFFKKLEQRFPGEFKDLPQRMNTLKPDMLPEELKSLLRSLDPTRATLAGSQLYFQSKVFEAVSLLAPYSMPTTTTKTSHELVEEIKAFLHAHYSHHITLDDIAKTFYLSRSKLCALFQQETHTSLGAYLRSYRITKACELLENTTLSIAEVGCLVGYPRASTFTEVFLHEIGITPTKWRHAKGCN